MTKNQTIQRYMQGRHLHACTGTAEAFAPANIALIKYWGKRDTNLNLPTNSSLSIDLGAWGATTRITVGDQDCVHVNGQVVSMDAPFARRLFAFLDLLDPKRSKFQIFTSLNIPVAAGFASSAAGFAALILCFNQLCGWDLCLPSLSRLARVGSGSAARSLWSGFVQWNQGIQEDGWDSHGQALPYQMSNLRIGLLIVSDQQKPVSSRDGMRRTVQSSPLYKAWPDTATQDLAHMHQALQAQDFEAVGTLSEHNALAMHATMMAARPSLIYSTPQTHQAILKIWQLRRQGLPLYFTQDAGPNLKLLFLSDDQSQVKEVFPDLNVIEV